MSIVFLRDIGCFFDTVFGRLRNADIQHRLTSFFSVSRRIMNRVLNFGASQVCRINLRRPRCRKPVFKLRGRTDTSAKNACSQKKNQILVFFHNKILLNKWLFQQFLFLFRLILYLFSQQLFFLFWVV